MQNAKELTPYEIREVHKTITQALASGSYVVISSNHPLATFYRNHYRGSRITVCRGKNDDKVIQKAINTV